MSRAVKMTELLIPCYKYLTSLLFLLDLKIVKNVEPLYLQAMQS